MSRQITAPKPGTVSRALARDRLGVPAVLFFVLAGVAPLTVAAGVIPTAYATTGLTGIPAAFLVIAVILAIFASGYVAMTRHITNAGAFYAFISHGLGRTVGVAAALVALLAYSLPAGRPVRGVRPDRRQPGRRPPAHARSRGGHGRWARGRSSPSWACCGWTSPAGSSASCCAPRSLVIVAETVSGLAHPAGGHLSFATLSPAALTSAGFGTVGVLAVVAVLGFVGFEQAPVLAEEARNPRRTIPVATYVALGMIAVVYAGASWAMAAHTGDAPRRGRRREARPRAAVRPRRQRRAVAGRAVAVPDLAVRRRAGLPQRRLAVHLRPRPRKRAARRARAAPAATTSPRPRRWPRAPPAWPSSRVYALAGWNPMTRLFFWLGTTGGFGILILLAVTSVAVVAFFARDPRGENAWRRLIAPALAAVLLARHRRPGHPALRHPARRPARRRGRLGAARQLPAVAVIGLEWGLSCSRSAARDIYAAIGLGAARHHRPAHPATADRTRP